MAKSVLSSVLTPDRIRTHLSASTKEEAIHELVEILAAAGCLSDAAAAEKAVRDREAVMSTGLEQGIAIPHGKTDAVDGLVAALAIKPDGLDFDCADGAPAHILVITLSPATRPGPHLRFMAETTRVLSRPSVRGALLAAQTSEQIATILAEAD